MLRGRAEGWQYAKLSGHRNEAEVQNLFSDEQYCTAFSQRLGIKRVVSATVGGLHEHNVESIIGKTTKSKTDLVLELDDGSTVNISIKKSRGGQVYLIGVDAFIAGFEAHFGEEIPNNVKDMLHLYFYGHPDIEQLLKNKVLVKGLSDNVVRYQARKKRLTWNTLIKYSESDANKLMQWIKDNIDKIAEFCFAQGLAKDRSNWADYVWYINTIGEADFDYIFRVSDISNAVKCHSDNIVPGKTLGGSTILLPFGFVQWHQQKMQFHHSLDKLLQIAPYK